MHILTCILKHQSDKKLFCATILAENVLKRQILTDLIARSAICFRNFRNIRMNVPLCFHLVFSLFQHITETPYSTDIYQQNAL